VQKGENYIGFMYLLFTKYCYGAKIIEAEMGQTCVINWDPGKAQKFWLENIMEEMHR
jgi:hypothetical protein